MIKKILTVFIVLFSFFALVGTVHAASTNYDIINLKVTNYNYNPAPVTAGKNFDLWIQLTNNSNITANNVEYYLDTKYPFTVLNKSNLKTISKLDAYQSQTIKYTLQADKSAVDGTYELDFKVKRDGIDNYNIIKLNIDIKGSSAIVDIVNSNIQDAKIGSDSIISLDLKNLGQKNAQDIFITLNNSSDSHINVVGLQTQYISQLNINSSKTIDFKINVSKEVTKTSYTLPITIKYSDNGSTHTNNRNVGIQIVENPKMIVNVTTQNLKFLPNTDSELDLEIDNIGNFDSDSVYVDLETKASENIPNYFIGTIQKNNYDVANFKFKTIDKPGTYPVTIIIHYKDNNLKDQTITKKVNITIESNNQKGNAKKVISVILGIIGFVIALALLIVILKWLFNLIVKPAIKIIKDLFLRK